MPFRPDIEGLRAVAVLLVVAFHLGVPGIRGGFVGVDVFFVLSGYLITGLLVRERETTGHIAAAAFYARRVRRLLPAFAVVLAITMAVACVIASPQELVVQVGMTAQAAAVDASNLLFAHRAVDYFSPHLASNPLLHTWSLAVEEQFYLVWPWLLLLGTARGRSRRTLVGLLTGVAALSLALCWWFTRVRQPTAFYTMPPRAWEFAAGGLAWLVPAWPPAARRPVRWISAVLGWLGLGLLVSAALWYTTATPFPGLAALLPVGGTVLVLRAGARDAAGGPRPMLTTPSLQWIGQRSYSWYLWHWPVWILGTIVWPQPPLAGRVLLGSVALGLAAVTYRVIERPMRDARRWRRAPARILAAGVVTSAALVGMAGLVRALGTTLAARPGERALAAAVTDFPALYAAGCGEDAADPPVVHLCALGAATGTTTVVLFGDSHVAQWAPAFERLAQARGWRLLVITKSSCATADVPVYAWPLQREFTECATWRKAALDTIRRRHPQLVVLANMQGYLDPRPDGRPTLTPTAWAAGLTRTLDTLAAAGVPVVVLRDTPALGFDGPTCLARFALLRLASRACATPAAVALNGALAQAERTAVPLVPGDRFVDLTARLCPNAVCPAELDHVVVYRDDNHLTATFAASLTDALAQALGPLPARPGAPDAPP